MRNEIEAFLETWARQDCDAAVSAHKSRLQNAWMQLIDAVEDTDVAALVPQSMQNEVSRGRQILQRIKFDVARAIDAC